MLLDSGNEVILIDKVNPLQQKIKRYQFIYYTGMFGLGRLPFRKAHSLGNWLQAARLRLVWRRIRPDIVHVHWIDMRAYQCALAGIHPLMLTCWGSDINNFFETNHEDDDSRQRTFKALLAADCITADTDEVLERCELLAGRKLKTSLFYFGIDLEKFKAENNALGASLLKDKYKIPSNSRVVLSIRRLVPMMGHHHILRAFASMAAQTNEKLVLLLHHYLGKDEDYEQKLRDLAVDLGISHHIVWLDNIADEEMPALYALADLVVNFPDYDGLPVSLFEAAASKKPVITNNLPAYRQILSQGAFTIVNPGDPSQLAGAMLKVLGTSKEELESQYEVNYALMVRIADQRQCIRKMNQLYSDMVKIVNHAPSQVN